jgi:cytochrome P450
MQEIAVVLPVWAIHRIIGLPDDQLDRFHDLAVGLQLIKTRPDLAMASTEILADLLRSVIRERRDTPGDTTIDVLIQAHLDGEEPLTDEEILGFLRVLLPAGGETTTRNLGSLATALLTHPDQLELLCGDRQLIGTAIDEALRWESPTQFTYRIATRDVEIAGVEVPAGAGLNLCIGAANRDPAKFPDPDRFDLTRSTRGHLAFGQGVHMCIGQHLARTEVRLAADALLDRLPGLRIDPDAGPPVVRGSTFRWPPQVRVVWDG